MMREKGDDLEFEQFSEDHNRENLMDRADSTNDNYGFDFSDRHWTEKILGTWLPSQSKHPITIVFHILFKVLSLLVYIFGGIFTSSFIVIFVFCILLLVFDFWTGNFKSFFYCI